jgi:hypothetical protein
MGINVTETDERRKVPIVDGIRTRWLSMAVAPERGTSASSIQSALASKPWSRVVLLALGRK